MTTASAAFDAHAAEYDLWYESAQGRALFASEVDATRLLMLDLEHPFLEIGVGTGRFAEELGIDAGIDPSEQALAPNAGLSVEASASTLAQSPLGNPYREQAQAGISKGAGFLCFRARKASGGAND